MGLFGLNRHLPIALDLGSRSIRMMQLRRIGDSIHVMACDSWQYPSSVGTDPAQRRNAAIEVVRQMLHSGDFKGRQVITALSCSQLDIKNVRLPKMPSAQLDCAVRAEAEERYDFPITADQLNYLDAGEARDGNEFRREIIMLAVPQDVIDEHVSMISAMGLAPEHIDAGPVALFRVFERFLRRQSDEGAVSVAVDIGQSGTRVVVARGRDIAFIKAIDIGGQQLTESVARHANLDFEEASELRRRARHDHVQVEPEPGDEQSAERSSVDWTIRDALRSEVEALTREVALCMRYCSVTFRGLRPSKVHLTGGEACDPTLVEMFQEQLGMECLVSSPLRGIDVSSVDLGVHRGGVPADWASCVGLAIRTVDVAEFGEEDDNEERRLSA